MEECNKGAEWGFDISSAESYQIAKYDVGDYYKPHLDSIGTQSTRWIAKDNSHLHNKTRKISMSLILNDGFEGGDLEIFGVPTPKLETGSMIFFPSFIAHEVTPVTKGTRHSLVMLFLGTPWR
jgi:PKHD-type hydroxylase